LFKKKYVPHIMDYNVISKQIRGDLNEQIAGMMDLETQVRVEMLDPILLVDNQNDSPDLLDAYITDKGVINILGKSGTPIKTRIPTPDPQNPKGPGLGIRVEEDKVM